MACTRVGNGIVCSFVDDFVDMTGYGSKVWMEWHHYMGPVFYRSKAAITPIQHPSKKTWAAFEKWQKSRGQSCEP